MTRRWVLWLDVLRLVLILMPLVRQAVGVFSSSHPLVVLQNVIKGL